MPSSATELFHPAHGDAYAATLRRGVDHLVAQLATVRGPATGRSPAEAEAPVAAVDLDRPLADLDDALAEVSRLWLDDAVWFHEPGYAAHLNCPVVIPALLAEVFVSAVNSSLDTFDQSVGATFLERHLVDWVAGRIGFPTAATGHPGADGIFTSGGTQSNLQALHLARDRAREDGVGTDRLRVLTSADGHFSVATSARLLGLGADAVVPVPVDERRRMQPGTLARALAACRARDELPIAVVATAGTTDFGAIDPLPEIAELCRRHGTWLHVDAAYGGGLLASRRHRGRLAGIEHADSVTVDFHKTWFQPVSCSALVVRDARTLRHVAWHADYLNPRGGTDPNQVDKSLQTTRRFEALKLWLTLRVMGADAIGDMIDDLVELTATVHALVGDLPDLELAVDEPSLTTLVLRYRPTGMPEPAVEALNTRIRAALYRGGRHVVAATRVDGRGWLKLTLLNPLAGVDDVLETIAAIRVTGAALAAPAGEVAS